MNEKLQQINEKRMQIKRSSTLASNIKLTGSQAGSSPTQLDIKQFKDAFSQNQGLTSDRQVVFRDE